MEVRCIQNRHCAHGRDEHDLQDAAPHRNPVHPVWNFQHLCASGVLRLSNIRCLNRSYSYHSDLPRIRDGVAVLACYVPHCLELLQVIVSHPFGDADIDRDGSH